MERTNSTHCYFVRLCNKYFEDNKFKQLRDLLFQNRQPRLTIFIYRRNCDSVWLFAGLTDRTMFSMIMSQFELNGKDWWETYSDLNFREVMIIDFSSDGTKIKFLQN
jgi:hypothetical protein